MTRQGFPTTSGTGPTSGCSPDSPAAIIDTLDKSRLARGLLGDAIVDATVAVRRYEQRTSAELPPDELAERFRLAWSI